MNFPSISLHRSINQFKALSHKDLYVLKITKNENLFHIRNLSQSQVLTQVKPEPQTKLNIFDRQTKLLQRERAALTEDAEFHSYLKDEIGYRLADRIYDIKRTFPKVLDLGCGRGHVSKHVIRDWVEELVMCDNSETLVSLSTCDDSKVKTSKVVCDEENLLSVFEPDTFNMVISNLTLHWVNDLPKCFTQVMNILKNDGVFLGSMFGSDTLYELRSSLQLAELERKGGISPHISPFARPRDVGNLLTQAGFVMQTIDTDEEVLKYPTIFDLLDELKGMGENNAAWNRCLHLPRDTILAASAIYDQQYGICIEKDNSGRTVTEDEEMSEKVENFKGINATFQIIYFIGWKPDPSQPQPLPRGSGQSLKDLYNFSDEFIKEASKIKLDEEK